MARWVIPGIIVIGYFAYSVLTAQASIVTTIFTASGTWTAPTAVVSVTIDSQHAQVFVGKSGNVFIGTTGQMYLP